MKEGRGFTFMNIERPLNTAIPSSLHALYGEKISK